ncbi:glycosyltransferase family 39 protein [Candidatus Sumerlaeota bacterium]|nr:glycosyltransferase family 39 protein [Candidatus Sumerlaeota bacterium]
MTDGQQGSQRRTLLLVAMIVATWVALTLLRLFDGTNILDDDQERPAMYVLDVLVNNHWLVQYDADGAVMSKPPMFAWMGVIASKFTGGLNEISLYAPGALAVLATALLVFFYGRKIGSDVAAFVGAGALLLSNPSIKMVHLARTDGLFMLLVFASAVAALEAHRGRISWFWFWFLSAFSTLTKGPVGMILVAGGFLACFFGNDSSRRTDAKRIAAGHVGGILFFLVVAGGWFLAAYHQAGTPFIDKIIGRELVGHATESARGDGIGSKMHQPPIYFLSRFAPWSLFTLLGFWCAFKQRKEGSFASFASLYFTCYFLFGLLLFSLSPHQRFDHQFPIIPAAALIAGIAIEQWAGASRREALVKWFPAVAVILLIAVKAYHVMNVTKDERRSLLLKRAAGEIPANVELQYGDSLMGLQFFRGTMQVRQTAGDIAALLRAERPAYVAIRREDTWKEIAAEAGIPTHKLAEWVPEKEDEAYLTIYSNRESFPPLTE